MTRLLLSTLSLIAVTAIAHADAHDHPHDGEVAHVFEGHGLHITHPWLRATERGDAYVFLEIHNEGDQPRQLTGAQADWAGAGAVVGFSLKGGEGRYAPLPELPLAAGAEMALRPNELAIRLPEIREPLHEGDHVHLELITDAGPIAIDATVEAADAANHGHAGHSH